LVQLWKCPEDDPNTWHPDDHEHRIYLDDNGDMFALVDAEDYWFFSRWRWALKIVRGARDKHYAYRTLNGAGGQHTSLLLHRAIMFRHQIKPPTPEHVLVDHRSGRSLDCRKHNIRWATHSMNRVNVFGQYPNDMHEN
jgi:hypothetical protein